MKKNILITGANGMLSKHLTKQLEGQYSIRYLTRKVTRKNEYSWDLKKKHIDANALKDVHTIIHLAGSPIADKRWTKKRKQSILSSRVDSAQLILDQLKKNNITIDSFISASAIGYYGTSTTNNVYSEENKKGNDFLSNVCHKWEHAAHEFKSSNVANRVAILRIGVILSTRGGALKKIVFPIKYGIGSALGTGNQYMPWIHIEDLCRMFSFILNDDNINRTFNAVAPEHITNAELTKKIGQTLKRPILLPNIPKFIFKMLFGEMSIILLEGSRVSSNKILEQGFSFKYDNLTKALNNLLKKNKH
ncbi:TIGR01777 family oxidoreductase [Cyclobacteriaceae bacterium]|nr:TIGR01777 family oxidoreductase [Cyclobacteriaceae bacterium]